MYVKNFGKNRHLAYLQNLENINETATPLLKFQSRLLLLTDQWRNMYSVVDDLVMLENGVEMYSITHDEVVLVVVPLLLIQADNWRHSELAMHKGSSAGYFCRKCMIKQADFSH